MKIVNWERTTGIGGLLLLIIIGGGAILKRVPESDKNVVFFAIMAIVSLGFFAGAQVQEFTEHGVVKKKAKKG